MSLSHISSFFSLSDEEAMLRVQKQSDARAFALLVRRWERPIQGLCTPMTGDVHRGEDLAQETFVRLFAHRTSSQPGARFSTFLWRIALNLCRDEHRRKKRRAESSLDCGEGQSHSAAGGLEGSELPPHSALMQKERARIVRVALSQLPESYRAVVVLRHYQDLKFREIAEILDIPEGTVKSRMAEALTRLARMLKPRLSEEAG